MPPTNAETKVQDREYKNWLRVTLALYYLKDGLLSFIKREVDAMHQSLSQKVSRGPGLSAARCSNCRAKDVIRNRYAYDWKFQPPCPSRLCDAWLTELLTLHINPTSCKIYWGNCKVTAWPFEPWECAKLYMPRGQPTTNTGPDMSDSQALLTLMASCSYFHGKLSSAGLNLTHKVSTIRNRVMHSEDMGLSDDDRKCFIDDIIHLLEDPTHLRSLEECQQAVAEIDKINKDSVDVFFNHDLEMKALRECVNDCRQQQGNLKNDTELSIESLKMEIKELKAQVFKNQVPTDIMESGTAAMRSFTLEDIKQAWQSIETELKEELDPANILSFFTFLSENECQAIRCKKKRREMVERFLLRIEENLPESFSVLLSALEKTGKGSLVNTLENIINGANSLQAMAHVSNMSSIKVKVSVVTKAGSKSHNAEMKIKDDFVPGSSVFSSDLCSIVITVERGSIIVHLRPVSKHAQETLAFFCKHGGMKDYILNLLRKKDLFASLPVGEVSVEVEVSCHKEGEAYADANEPMEDFISENIEVVDNPQVIRENLLLQYGSLLEEIDPLNLQETFIGREILDTGFFQGLTHLRRRERAAEFLNKVLHIGSNALVGLAEALKSSGRENLAKKLCCAVKKMPQFGDREQVDEALVQVVREDSQMHVDECVLWSCHLDLLIGRHAGDEREETVTEETSTQGIDKIMRWRTFNEMAASGCNEEFGTYDLEEIRVVALGKNGSGKSSTGNSFLGSWKFLSDCSPKSVTENCQFDYALRFGKRLVYVDTPDFFNIEKPNEIIQKEIIKCIALSSPGPHVFLLIIMVDRFTPEEKETIGLYEKIFGDEFYNHLIVVFTHKDKLDKSGKSLEQFVSEAPSELQNVLIRNNNICIAIENGASPEEVELQMKELFNRITFVVGMNGGKHFTNTTYGNIEERLLEEEDMEMRSCKEKLTNAIEDKDKSIDKISKDVREEKELLQELVGSLPMNTETISTEVIQSVEDKINQLDKENEKLRDEIILMKEEIRRIEKESKEHTQKPGWFRDYIRKVIVSENGQLVVNILSQFGLTILNWGIESFKSYMTK